MGLRDNIPVLAGAGKTSQLLDREAVLAEVLAAVSTPAAPPLTLVGGPMGIGRSAVLSAVADKLAGSGVTTLASRVTYAERARPFALAARLATEIGAPERAADEAWAAVPAPSDDPATSVVGRLASALAANRSAGRTLVVLLDDLQWIDSASLGALVYLLPMLANTSVKVVGAVRFPRTDPASANVMRQLREAGLVTVLRLRALSLPAVNALVTRELRARPSEHLADTLRRSCRGVPGAVHAALTSYQKRGRLHVVGRYAYLAAPDRPPQLIGSPPIFEFLRELDEPVWPVAKALAVLSPLGPAAPGLIARALDIGEDAVGEALDVLSAEGVVRHLPRRIRWRFRLPLVATALTGCLGEYERRRLAQVAVNAIWSGEAIAEDDDYLPERLVDAGQYVDHERAGAELLARGAGRMLHNGYYAERWLRAAVDRLTAPEDRARALFLHAATCCIHQRFTEAVDSAWTVLSGRYAALLPPEVLLELEMIYVIALAVSRDTEALRNIVNGGWNSLPGGEGHQILARCAALCHLDRWRDADEQLQSTQPIWQADPTVIGLCLIYGHTTAAFLGHKEGFDRIVTDPASWPLWANPRNRFELLAGLIRILNAFGELDRGKRLLTTHDLPASHSPVPDQVVAQSLAGQWDAALNGARLSLATNSSLGYPPAHTLMCKETGTILVARGRLHQARSVLEDARTAQPVLTHLLALPEADLELVLNAPDRARQAVADGLATATDGGVVIGTDELWLRLTNWAVQDGDRAEAERCAAEAERVADLIDTGRSRLCALQAVAMAREDRAAADDAIRLARERGQPYELATTLVQLAQHHIIDGTLLREAYDLYGELDALLVRARLRTLMRERGVGVPGRAATVADDERLLATLVTDGLTNRELAEVLATSEKSVEGKLTRLFQRSGYRSRVELASATLTGEYKV
jgi:hypothetical protein